MRVHEGASKKILIKVELGLIKVKVWFVKPFLHYAVFQRVFMKFTDDVSGVILFLERRSKSPMGPINFNRSPNISLNMLNQGGDDICGSCGLWQAADADIRSPSAIFEIIQLAQQGLNFLIQNSALVLEQGNIGESFFKSLLNSLYPAP